MCTPFVLEQGILGFGIRTTAQGIRNPTKDWNPESEFHRQILPTPLPGIQNPESKTGLDSLKAIYNLDKHLSHVSNRVIAFNGLRVYSLKGD